MLDSIPTIIVTSKEQIYSYLGLIMNILVYLVPCAQLADVIETGDADLFPVPALTFAGLIANGLWGDYSLRVHSIAYFVSNMLGVVCNSMQLVVWSYVLFMSKKRQKQLKTAADLAVHESDDKSAAYGATIQH